MSTDNTANPKISRLVRKFKFNATVLADADPSLPPPESLALYAGTYPFLANATLGEPEEVDGELVYPVNKPVVQTKGASMSSSNDVDKAVERIMGWQSALPTQTSLDKWSSVYKALRKEHRTESALVDSAFLPLI